MYELLFFWVYLLDFYLYIGDVYLDCFLEGFWVFLIDFWILVYMWFFIFWRVVGIFVINVVDKI